MKEETRLNKTHQTSFRRYVIRDGSVLYGGKYYNHKTRNFIKRLNDNCYYNSYSEVLEAAYNLNSKGLQANIQEVL